MTERAAPTELIAFDFDETIVDVACDIQIKKLSPNGAPIPKSIVDLDDDRSFIDYMTALFEYFHANAVTREAMLACLEEIPLIDGIEQLFSYLVENHFEIIIISDANSMFIEHLLKYHNLHTFVSRVYTNRAFFEQQRQGDATRSSGDEPSRGGGGEVLRLEKYHVQDWCPLSSTNLCKGFILEEHIKKRKDEQGVEFRRVYYSGDGANDLCPSLKLKEGDVCFARMDYALAKHMARNAVSGEHKMQANVVLWKTANDILEYLRNTRV